MLWGICRLLSKLGLACNIYPLYFQCRGIPVSSFNVKFLPESPPLQHLHPFHHNLPTCVHIVSSLLYGPLVAYLAFLKRQQCQHAYILGDSLSQGSAPCPRKSTSSSSFSQRESPRPLTQLRTTLKGHPISNSPQGQPRLPLRLITLLLPLPQRASFSSLPKVRIPTALPNKLPGCESLYQRLPRNLTCDMDDKATKKK